MYPYGSRQKWLIANRFDHLRTALSHSALDEDAEETPLLRERMRQIALWNKVRGAVLAILILSALGASVISITNLLVSSTQLVGALRGIVQIASTLAGIASLALLLVTRLLGQLEVDILALLMLHNAGRIRQHHHPDSA